MKKFKLLTLTTLGVGLLSGLSFAQEFPVNVTATVTAPAPQYVLRVDGVEADALRFNLGDTVVGKQAARESTITFSDMNGVIKNKVNVSYRETTLKNNIGEANLIIKRGSADGNGFQAVVMFTPLAPGQFTQSTVMNVIPQ